MQQTGLNDLSHLTAYPFKSILIKWLLLYILKSYMRISKDEKGIQLLHHWYTYMGIPYCILNDKEFKSDGNSYLNEVVSAGSFPLAGNDVLLLAD